jgi:hypothetical protein
MTTATGARHSAGIIAESVYGTTPATPAFADVRHTSFSVGMNKNTFESAEVRSDRQIAHFRHGVKNIAGDIGIELSYTTFDTMLEALMGGAWSTDVLKAGTSRRSFTIERKFANIAVPEWHRFTGCEINSLSLSITPDAIVTGSFGIIGKDQVIDTAIITGATYPAATVTEPYDSFTGTINEGGSSIGIITGIDLTIENGLTPLFVVGSDTTDRPSIGKSRVTGTVNAYFESKTLLEKFINETESSFDFTLTDGTSSIQFDMNTIKYTGGQPDVDGDGEVTIALPFTALYTVADLSQLVITRTP